MKPYTSCNDEALLLRVHGELTPSAHLRLLVHLAGCSACRARLRHYSRLSGQLAQGLAQEGQPPRVSPAHSLPVPAPLWVVLGLVAAILVSLGTLVGQVRRTLPPLSPATAAAAPEPEECLPPAGSPEADKLGSSPPRKTKKH